MSRSRLADRRALAAFLLLVCSGSAHAATIIVAGIVRDSSTGAPVAGADVSIQRGGADLGQTVSAVDGAFQLPFDVVVKPEAQNLTLLVRKDAFVSSSHNLVVTAGRPSANSFKIDLVPAAMAECIRPSSHSVVVGYFRPSAASVGDPDIAARVADALNYDLLVRMQQEELAHSALPIIIACGGAKPRAVGDYGKYAKVLRADAFLVGSVNDTALTKVKVEMAVIDGHGILPLPLRASSPEVNLDDPSVARLDASAHAAILTALVGGYERSGKFAECVDMTNAAARIVGTLPAALQSARARCEQRLPNRGLLSGGTP